MFQRLVPLRIPCLIVHVLGALIRAKTFCILMQLREQDFQLVDVHIQDSLKKLAAHFFEPDLQVRDNPPSPVRSLDNLQTMVARIASPRKKTVRLQPVYKARDLAFVPTHGSGQFSRGSFPLFHAVNQHRGLLRRHPKLAKAAIEGSLKSYACAE